MPLQASDAVNLAGKVRRLEAENERLREALEQVRLDICESGVVVFRISPPSQTTFDYIGQELGDEVTWEEWEARQALNKKTPQ